MGKTKWTYWSNESKKPKGFSFVKGSSMTYTYEVPVYSYEPFKNNIIDRVFIKVKMIRDKDGYGGLNIDDTFVINYIQREITDKFSFESGLFKRDGASFPFINKIDVINADEYLHSKKIKQRKLKLEQIKNKINV
jgi:hypothetical protein